MSCHFRPSFFCMSSGYDQSPRSLAPALFVPKVNFAPFDLARRRKASLGILYRALISIATPCLTAASITRVIRSSVQRESYLGAIAAGRKVGLT